MGRERVSRVAPVRCAGCPQVETEHFLPAEVVDDEEEGLLPIPHLQVWAGEWEMVLYPRTQLHADGGRFPLCDIPQWDDAAGMPFAPLEAWGVDLCDQ